VVPVAPAAQAVLVLVLVLVLVADARCTNCDDGFMMSELDMSKTHRFRLGLPSEVDSTSAAEPGDPLC